MSTQKTVDIMTSAVLKVGMREFRAHLPQYLLTSTPVAVTRHGETVGYYIPSHHHSEKPELESLKRAAKKLEALLLAQGVTEDELLAEFRALRSKEIDKKTGSINVE